MIVRKLGLALTTCLALAACDEAVQWQTLGSKSYAAKNVQVYSRTWAVRQVSDEPVIYRATRDWNNLNPYGPPARTRTSQAVAAIQQATGCKVIRSTMYQNVSGQFFSQVTC